MERKLGLLLAALLGAACSMGYPFDPERTTERVQRTGVIRVGLTEHRPWVVRGAQGEPSGVEVEIVRRFAARRGATLDWTWGQQERLLSALERFELDLVIGGIDARTPWKDRVALTRPWSEPPDDSVEGADQRLVLALAPGENRWLGELERFVGAQRQALARLAAEAAR